MPKKNKNFVADFETTTQIDDCRVWCYSISEIGYEENTHVGKDIKDFIDYIQTLGNCNIYFHNLKFDSQFIIYYFLTNGYKHFDTNKHLPDKGFTTLINDMGVFYSVEVKFKKNSHVVFYDSYKKLPFSVKALSKAFNIPEVKGEIDYQKERPIGYELDENEKNYVMNDTIIVSKALNIQFDTGLTRMTIGSDALAYYKTLCNFSEIFPVISVELDNFIRKSYKGGWVYLKPEYSDVDLGAMEVYDVNSLFPSRMYYCLLPYDMPMTFKGKYIYDKNYPLYIIHILTMFKLKPRKLPTIQVKGQPFRFLDTEYITECLDDPLELWLTNVDFELFQECYDIAYIEYIDGVKFKGQTGLFKDYIDHWNKIKVENSKEGGDTSLRSLAKLMLNNLYGKLATQTKLKRKVPYLKEDGIVGYTTGLEENKEPVYTAMSSFITAYARDLIVRSALKVYDNFVYADTDSLHLKYDEKNKTKIEVDDTELGKFKLESEPRRARFLRSKTYLEEIYNPKKDKWEFNIKGAGMTPEIKELVTWDNFHIGFKSDMKHQQKIVKGGVVICNVPFEIKAKK